MFCRRKGAAKAGQWAIHQGTYEGRVLFARWDHGARHLAGSPERGIRIGIAVPLADPTDAGLPQDPEFGQLDEIEEAIVELAKDRAMLVGVITTNGMREFILYAGTPEWIPAFHEDLKARIGHHEIRMVASTDPDWAFYRSFVS